MDTLKFILITWLKRSSKKVCKIGGFTLIELLVAIIVAALIISPLLGFMVNILETDNKEQAKGNSEQELQAAIDFIARDLQQSVYIYDQDGVAQISGEIPSSADQTPVLVFWKRKLLEDSIPIGTTTASQCLNMPATSECDDAFVYSLVAYYLIIDNNTTWSDTARIGRFEIQDGVRNPATGNYVDENDSTIGRDDGFQLFDLDQGGSLSEKMNLWQQASGESYTSTPVVLMDFVDQSTSGVPNEACPTDPEWTQLPDYGTVNSKFQTYSFYACVNSSSNIARVHVRGNALARMNVNTSTPTYSTKKSSFFPRIKREVRGTGSLK